MEEKYVEENDIILPTLAKNLIGKLKKLKGVIASNSNSLQLPSEEPLNLFPPEDDPFLTLIPRANLSMACKRELYDTLTAFSLSAVPIADHTLINVVNRAGANDLRNPGIGNQFRHMVNILKLLQRFHDCHQLPALLGLRGGTILGSFIIGYGNMSIYFDICK